MSDDEREGPVRRPRAIARPRVPPGPLHDLKNLLYELYLAAGTPTLDAIAEWIRADKHLGTVPGRDTVGRCLGSSELPANQRDAAAVASVLAREAGWNAAAEAARIRDLWVRAAMVVPVGWPLSEVTDPFALEVHRAIDVGAGSAGLPLLPPYLERTFDRELKERAARAATGASTLIVLVGGSSTGKTRACWEALQHLPKGWRLWHPFDPTRPDAVLDMVDQVWPRTVVWLNEAQDYLLTEGSDRGERVAAGLRALLVDRDRSPVLVLGTMWPEDWDVLTRRPESREGDAHGQARELLAGSQIVVPESFPPQVIESLKTGEEVDPRLIEAAFQAEDGELTQYLAGAPALLERYETAPAAGRALLNAAMDIRRLGHGPAIPISLLQGSTPAYLTDREWQTIRRDDDWFATALAYCEFSCHGAHSPLACMWPRSGQPEPHQPRYRLADYLEQIGRRSRQRKIVPPLVWHALIDSDPNPADAAQLGHSADSRKLYCHAIPLLTIAADAGDEYAAYRLADLLAKRGDVEGAIRVLQVRADAGDTSAAWRLADLLVERGDVEKLRIRADAGDTSAALQLADLLVERGDVEELRIRADAGDTSAPGLLADLLVERGDVEELRIRADAGDTSAAWRLADLLAKRGDVEELRIRADAGDTSAALRLADLLAKRGDVEGAIRVSRAWADTGDFGATWQLADLLVERGDVEELRIRADAGDRLAAKGLVKLLVERGDVEELRIRADAGDLRAPGLLADLLVERSDVEQLRIRADAGEMFAAWRLADLLVERGDVEELRIRADAGDRLAAKGLVKLLVERGDVEGAIRVLQVRADAGDTSAAERLANLLAKRGDVEELRIRADAGDTFAAWRLADLLVERGDVEGAIRVLQVRADAGDTFAAWRLADLLAKRGDVEELRIRADAGDTSAAERLAKLLAERGDVEELRIRADAGDTSAAERLAKLLAKRGDVEELRIRADAGETSAAERLAKLLAKRGDFESLRMEVLRGNEFATHLLEKVVAEHDLDAGERLRQWGLDADGQISMG